MNYGITDPQLMISQAGELAQINQNILRINEEIASCVYEISSAWTSTTEDRESYLGEINKIIGKIGELCAIVRTLSDYLTDNAELAIKEANGGI